MADEEAASGGGSGLSFFLIFFGAIFALWLFSGQGGGGSMLLGSGSTTYSLFNVGSTSTETVADTSTTTETVMPGAQYTARRDAEESIEEKYDEVADLKEELRLTKLWGVVSPHKEHISLSASTRSETNARSEYLSLYLSTSAPEPVSISGWTIESTVTGVRAVIPSGVRLPGKNNVTPLSNIVLEPGETAYIISGESPIGVSFLENICSGYLTQHQEFYPSIYSNCPSPISDLKNDRRVPVTDDSCYDAVESFSYCRVPDIDDLKLSSSCRTFIQDTLTYAGCIQNHQNEPRFYRSPWRVYLGSRRELWRTEREIIRVLDAQGKTVSVMEY